MTEDTRVRALAAGAPDRRMLVLFLLVGFAFVFFLLNLAGFNKITTLIQNAQPTFVLCVMAAQALRYVGSTGSTQILAEMFGQRLPFTPLY